MIGRGWSSLPVRSLSDLHSLITESPMKALEETFFVLSASWR